MGGEGEVTQRLRTLLTGIQRGKIADPFGWARHIDRDRRARHQRRARNGRPVCGPLPTAATQRLLAIINSASGAHYICEQSHWNNALIFKDKVYVYGDFRRCVKATAFPAQDHKFCDCGLADR